MTKKAGYFKQIMVSIFIVVTLISFSSAWETGNSNHAYIINPNSEINSTTNNNYYVTNGTSINITTTNKVGSDFTGSSGDTNRNITLDEPIMIMIDNYVLFNTTDYTYTNGDIIILNKLWDDQKIQIWYESTGEITTTSYVGSDLAGASGDTSRTLVYSSTPLFINVDNYLLLTTTDYSYTGGTITFVNKIWDDQKIQVWS